MSCEGVPSVLYWWHDHLSHSEGDVVLHVALTQDDAALHIEAAVVLELLPPLNRHTPRHILELELPIPSLCQHP